MHEQTIRLVSGVTDADLSRVVDEGWDPPVTLGVRLVSVISDCLQHAGQAAFIRGILLRSGAEDRGQHPSAPLVSRCGQQVALVTLAPATRPGGRFGAGRIREISGVILPVISPGLVSTALICVIFAGTMLFHRPEPDRRETWRPCRRS